MEIRKASVYAIALVATLAILVGTLSGLDAVGLRHAKGTASLAENPPIHAIEHGSVTVSPDTHIETPALLRVTTNPPVPGKIIVDGVARDEWGLTWMKIASGDHTVTFSDLSGLAPPAAQTITAVSGQTSIVVGNYAIQGFLRVLTEGALDPTIYVNGEPNNDWGMWREAAPGTYTVSFGAVAGFTPPAAQTVTVNAGATTTVVGTYTTNPGAPGPDPSTFGFLRVTTNPAVASTISVDGIPRDDWGLTWMRIAPGTHTVSFATVYGRTPPAPRDVIVVAGETTVYDAQFIPHGALRVTTQPALAATIFVDGVARNDWGMWQSMEPGTYTVSFEPIAGFATPAPQTVEVRAGELTPVAGVYVRPTQSVSLNPTKDNTLCETADGSVSNGKGQHFFAGRTLSGAKRRAVLGFNVAGSIPAGATITSVRLTLSMSRTTAGLESMSLHAALADWGEGSSDATAQEGGCITSTTGDATWIHRFFNTQRWTTPGGDFVSMASATVAVDQVGVYTWGSTSQLVADVQRWLDQPQSNFGWELIGNEAATQTTKRFDSKDHMMASVRPLLTVEFAPASGASALQGLTGPTETAPISTGEPSISSTVASVRKEATFARRT
ncbi:MAG TPA: DNRLRE domain-containing protein [Thermoplasmata archaeon]|nr:DNRLRE domain-containing protein [Thermoplasmata archaeon]